MIEPFPLRWPDGWPTTPGYRRSRPKFDTAFARARQELLDELRRLGARDVVITSNLPTRRDGLPYADGRARGENPGVAVYWKQTVGGKVVDRVMACDRWETPGGNVRALALSIEAIRGLGRWGGSTIVDRAFSSFAALPGVPEIDWRGELVVDGVQPVNLAAARDHYRRRARELHPDVGGDPEAMSRLNRAWEAAQRELGA